MTDRLSHHQIVKSYDSGLINSEYQETSLNGTVDFDKILLMKNPEAAIQELPPQTLYQSLKSAGLSDCVEILPLISQDQFTRICDYDVWHDEKLSTKDLFSWLMLFKEHSQDEMANRFCDLEEEYQIASLEEHISTFDQDEYEKMSDELQDRLIGFPGGELYYHIRTQDPATYGMVESIIDAVTSMDVGYAFSLLTHAAAMPPNETESLLLQFRNARLEEDGFVTYEESLTAFTPTSEDSLLQKWKSRQPKQHHAVATPTGNNSFFQNSLRLAQKDLGQESLERLEQGFTHLSNYLSSASRIESGDIQGLKQIASLAEGTLSIALELLSRGDLNTSLQILNEEPAKELFRFSQSLYQDMRELIISAVKDLNLKGSSKLLENTQGQRFGTILDWLDSQVSFFGVFQTEVLKGVFNRFPMIAVKVADEQYKFKPVSSLKDLHTMLQAVDDFLFDMYLYTLSENKSKSVEKTLHTSFASVLLGKEFTSKSLTTDEASAIDELSQGHLAETQGSFCKALQSLMLNQPRSISFIHSTIPGFSPLHREKRGNTRAASYLNAVQSATTEQRRQMCFQGESK